MTQGTLRFNEERGCVTVLTQHSIRTGHALAFGGAETAANVTNATGRKIREQSEKNWYSA